MKKILRLLAIVLILSLLVGCSPLFPPVNGPDSETTNPSNPVNPTTPSVEDPTTPPSDNPDAPSGDNPVVTPSDDNPVVTPSDDNPVTPPDDNPVEPPVEPPVEEYPETETVGNFTYDVIHLFLSEVDVKEDGIYNSMEEVAVYIYLFNKLPSNYSTNKSEVTKGYTAENKLSYTGGTFYNREGLLPNARGRTFTELDIGYTGGGRNALRIVYSSDGLIFYTSDHYASFSLVRVHNDVD